MEKPGVRIPAILAWVSVLWMVPAAGAVRGVPEQPAWVGASASYGTNTAEQAFDGNLSTAWQSPGGRGWLECSFDAPTEITHIDTLFESSHVVDARIEVSDSAEGSLRLLAAKKQIRHGAWSVSFAPTTILRCRTTLLRCAHEWTPEQEGEWPYVYEQQFARHVDEVPPFVADLPFASVPLVGPAPVRIDGILDDPAWNSAAVLGCFSWEGCLVSQQTTVRLLVSENALYLGATALEDRMADVPAMPPMDGQDVWWRDCLEVFIAPEAAPDRYAHIGFSVDGGVCLDLRRGSGKGGPVAAKAVRLSEGWILEARLSMSELQLPAADHGQRYRFNVCRNETPHQELSTWSALHGGFHKPYRFGMLQVEGSSDSGSVGVVPRSLSNGGVLIAEAFGPNGAFVQWQPDRVERDPVEVMLGDTGAAIVNVRSLGIPAAGQFRILRGGEELYRTASFIIPENPVALEMAALQSLLDEVRVTRHQNTDVIRDPLGTLATELDALRRTAADDSTMDRMKTLKDDICKLRLANAAQRCSTDGTNGVGFVCAVSPMVKVLPHAPWTGSLTNRIALHAARNEFESMQAVVFAVSADLQAVQMKPGTLISRDRGRLFPGRVTLYNVENVACVAGPGTRVLPGNVYPDPLRPHQPFSMKAGERRAVWVECEIPEGTHPGVYEGQIGVEWNGAERDRVVFTIHVYPCSLPRTHALATPFVISPSRVAEYHGLTLGTPAYYDMVERYRLFSVKHRLDWLYYDGPDAMQQTLYPECVYTNSRFVWDFDAFDEKVARYMQEGMNAFAVGFSWGHLPVVVDGQGRRLTGLSAMSASEIAPATRDAFRDALARYAEHLKAKGWFGRAYCYVADEPTADHFPAIEWQGRMLLDADPEWRTMVTAVVPQLRDVFKIWCPNLAFLDPTQIEHEIQKGQDIWWYVCSGRYHPNYYIDYEAIDPRIHFWLTYRYGLKGVLYWRVNHWTGNPFVRAENFGDGYIFYPGPDGPLPSVRSMMIRDGIDDYDLLTLLQEMNPESDLLDVSPVCRSTDDYTHDPAVLDAHRVRVLEALGNGLP